MPKDEVRKGNMIFFGFSILPIPSKTRTLPNNGILIILSNPYFAQSALM